MEYPLNFNRNANLNLKIKQLEKNRGSWAEGWKAFQSGLQQENGFLFVTRQKCRFNNLRFIFAVLCRFACQGLTRWFIVLRPQKNEYNKEHISCAVLCEWQLDEVRKEIKSEKLEAVKTEAKMALVAKIGFLLGNSKLKGLEVDSRTLQGEIVARDGSIELLQQQIEWQ